MTPPSKPEPTVRERMIERGLQALDKMHVSDKDLAFNAVSAIVDAIGADKMVNALDEISECGPGSGPHISEMELYKALAANCKSIARAALAESEKPTTATETGDDG